MRAALVVVVVMMLRPAHCYWPNCALYEWTFVVQEPFELHTVIFNVIYITDKVKDEWGKVCDGNIMQRATSEQTDCPFVLVTQKPVFQSVLFRDHKGQSHDSLTELQRL